MIHNVIVLGGLIYIHLGVRMNNTSKEPRILGLFYLTAGICNIYVISKFTHIFAVLYDSRESLPKLTQFLISSNPYFGIICGCIPGVILILSDRKELNKPLVKACLIIFLMILIGITVVSLFLPLVVTIKKIG